MSTPVDTQQCMMYAGYIAPHGYGKIYTSGKSLYIHREVYKAYKGDIPTDMQIDHLCRVKSCMNIDHLEAVTQQVNIARMFGTPENFCKRGHELTDDNIYRGTYFNPSGELMHTRCCKICTKMRYELSKSKSAKIDTCRQSETKTQKT